MPIYVRAGAIIPVDPVRQYAAQPLTEPTTLRVYRGANGDLTLYDDDGISQDYLRNRGVWTRITWNDAAKRLGLAPGAPAGATSLPVAREFTVVMMPEGTIKHATYKGTNVIVQF